MASSRKLCRDTNIPLQTRHQLLPLALRQDDSTCSRYKHIHIQRRTRLQNCASPTVHKSLPPLSKPMLPQIRLVSCNWTSVIRTPYFVSNPTQATASLAVTSDLVLAFYHKPLHVFPLNILFCGGHIILSPISADLPIVFSQSQCNETTTHTASQLVWMDSLLSQTETLKSCFITFSTTAMICFWDFQICGLYSFCILQPVRTDYLIQLITSFAKLYCDAVSHQMFLQYKFEKSRTCLTKRKGVLKQ